MKKVLIFAAVAALTLVGCQEKEYVSTKTSGEMSFAPMYIDKAVGSRGYVEGEDFTETYFANLHADPKPDAIARQMQISAYLYPQNGEQKNYFVDKTYAKGTVDGYWHNKVGTEFVPIYWPVGGTMDFLAYSLSSETTGAGKSYNVSAVWDADNAASRVTLTVPGENTQNDILFASAYGVDSPKEAKAVDMTFNHAQAWLEFVPTGSVDDVNTDGIVTLKRIELENVYNAGKVAISNNKGNATAKWDFTNEEKQNIDVDNFSNVAKLNGTPQYLDMLIPQQTKTAFVIYYTLGSNPKELSYRFTTDQKTWLMGEKYVYAINITTSEVTVAPSVKEWNSVNEYNNSVKIKTTVYAGDGSTVLGRVAPVASPASAILVAGVEDEQGYTTYTCDTWGAQVTLKATSEGSAVFVKWSDDNAEAERTFTIYENTSLPEALFGHKVTTTTKVDEASRCTETDFGVVDGEFATVKAFPAEGYKFYKWYKDENLEEPLEIGDLVTEINGDEITVGPVTEPLKYYAKFIDEKIIPAKYQIGYNSYVYFSKGNLYWDSTSFGVEKEQSDYSFVELDVEHGWGAKDPEHVSLFFWTKEASQAYAEEYSGSEDDYTFFAANGGVFANWTVLSCSDWDYLLNSRSATNRFAKAKVNGVNGLLIFPDDYAGATVISGVGTINSATESFPNQSVSVDDWSTLESYGVAFLPAAGQCWGNRSVASVGYLGGYYTSGTWGEGGNPAYLSFDRTQIYTNSTKPRNYGFSVRLVLPSDKF